MLKQVKEMIMKKQEYLEAANILFDDINNVDDLILLNESPEIPEDDEDDHNDNDEIIDDKENDSDDEPIQEPKDDENDDGFDRSVENDEIEPEISDSDDLPDIVGRQTGEPIDGDDDDILNITMDLKSNTVSDTLPVPPSGAGEAIASDDILNTRIDSGFGNDDSNSLEPDEKEDKEENSDILTEAISLDGDPGDTGDDSTKEPDEDLGNTPEDTGEENEVTSAVRDKVSEADEPIDDSIDKPNGKEELLKKLGSITKSLEDAKRAVMNTIQ